jgi:hypothetical protein
VDGLKTGMLTGALALVVAAAAGAQPAATAATPGQRAQQIQARFQIGAMEGVLERAVQMGAQKLRMQVQAVAPDLLFIAGAPRARGFWLDGYGVFFDVDVPAIRRSLAWSFRMLEQTDRGLELSLAAMRQRVAAIDDAEARSELLQSLQQLERQVNPSSVTASRPGSPGAQAVSASGAPAAEPRPMSPEQAAVLQDPALAYTNEVKAALVNAMVEYSAPIPLSPDEWLTVAARDQDGTRLQPGEPYDVSTIVLRIKGADLAAYRAQQIDRDETLRRVEVKEY